MLVLEHIPLLPLLEILVPPAGNVLGADGAVPWSCLDGSGCFTFHCALQEQGKKALGSPSVLAQHERDACSLPGKVALLRMSAARCCAQNTTRSALKYQPVAMKLWSLSVVGREGWGLCTLQPTVLLAFSSRSFFSPNLLLCVPLAPAVPYRELSWVGDVL